MENKKPRTVEEQISVLKFRGMRFENEQSASLFLSRVSYFRLKHFWTDLLDNSSGEFKNNVFFEDIVERYEFDKSLRLILFDALEIVEVGLRSRIISVLSLSTGSGLWYLDETLFENVVYHERFVLDIKCEFGRSSDFYAREYILTHSQWKEKSLDGDSPEAWMILECATFGTLSKMYKNLKSQLPSRSNIANVFGLYSSRELSNWLESLSVLRNVVAHHSRLWNRVFAKKPVNIKSYKGRWLIEGLTEEQRGRAYGLISCLLYLCNEIKPDNGLKDQILDLISKHPNVSIALLGFSGDWMKQPLWK